MGWPAASSTRLQRSVWMPPRLLRLMMNSRMAMSGSALSSRMRCDLQVRMRSPFHCRRCAMRCSCSSWARSGPRATCASYRASAAASASMSTASSPCRAFIFATSPGSVPATTTSSQCVVSWSTSQRLPKTRSRRKDSFFLSRTEGLNSAPETASSFSAILRLRICQEYCRSVAHTCVTRSRVSNPVTSGGMKRCPRQSTHRAVRGGTSDRPWLGLRGCQ